MDDRADNPENPHVDPETVRTASAMRPPVRTQSPEQPAEQFHSMFDHVPRSLVEPLLPKSAAEQTKPGFLPPGAGLLPVGLLPGQEEGHPRPAADSTATSHGPPPGSPTTVPPGRREMPAAAQASRQYGWTSYLRKTARWLVFAAACWLALVAGLVVFYRFANPPMSALMLQRWLTGEQVTQSWVPIDAISPSLIRAVLVSEDGRFCQHSGIDLEAMQIAIERAGEGTPRGASTISMQVAKNLFLWPSKSYLRKALELPLTLAIETVWPKRRIMEVYLNVAEWGPGIYGAEAAARHHFKKPARSLSDREAALLAVTLPNPIRRDAGEPGPGTRRLAGLIQARARAASRFQTACVLLAPDRAGEGGWRPEIRRDSSYP